MKKTLGNQPNIGENESSRSGADNTVPALTTPAAKDSDDMADTDSSKSPAFQFYPADFLSDPNVLAMSLAERGAYITLICLCWLSPLPCEVTRLARLCGVPLAAFRKMWPSLSVCFRTHPTDTSLMVHPRLERERAKQNEYRRKQSDKGRASAANRKATGRQPEGNHGSTEPPTERQPDTQPQGNSSSSSSSSSSDFSQRAPVGALTHARGIGSGVMGGTLQRDHLRHSWCGRVCVPEFLHLQFVAAIGGTDPDTVLRAFYHATFLSIPDSEPVEADPLKFWRPRISTHWPSRAVSEGTRTQALRRATEEFTRS